MPWPMLKCLCGQGFSVVVFLGKDMEVWDSEREKRLDSVHVKSEDFIHLIEQLIA